MGSASFFQIKALPGSLCWSEGSLHSCIHERPETDLWSPLRKEGLKIWQFGIFSQVIPLGLCGVLKFLVRVRYIISTVHLGFSAKSCAVGVAFLRLLFGMSLLCDSLSGI